MRGVSKDSWRLTKVAARGTTSRVERTPYTKSTPVRWVKTFSTQRGRIVSISEAQRNARRYSCTEIVTVCLVATLGPSQLKNTIINSINHRMRFLRSFAEHGGSGRRPQHTCHQRTGPQPQTAASHVSRPERVFDARPSCTAIQRTAIQRYKQ